MFSQLLYNEAFLDSQGAYLYNRNSLVKYYEVHSSNQFQFPFSTTERVEASSDKNEIGQRMLDFYGPDVAFVFPCSSTQEKQELFNNATRI
jgi:hypothetical protein